MHASGQQVRSDPEARTDAPYCTAPNTCCTRLSASIVGVMVFLNVKVNAPHVRRATSPWPDSNLTEGRKKQDLVPSPASKHRLMRQKARPGTKTRVPRPAGWRYAALSIALYPGCRCSALPCERRRDNQD
jgi:hypothetical protein